MKYIILLFIIITVIVLGSSCKSEKKSISTSPPELKVSGDLLRNDFMLSDLIKDCYFIPLETTTESIIGSPNKIIFYNNKIYVFDSQKAKSLFIFSNEGKFIRKISCTGRGPGEFLDPTDFCIEPSTNNIVFTDGKSLKYFDDFGRFVKTITIPIPAWRIGFTDENHISCVPGGREDRLVILSLQGKRVKSYFKFNEETTGILPFPFIDDGASGSLYLNNFDYTIYKIEGTIVKPHITINYSANMLTPGDIRLLREDRKNASKFYRIIQYLESPTYVIVFAYFQNKPYYIFHNKITLDTKFIDYSKVVNDITGTRISIFLLWGKCFNNSFFTCIEANALKNTTLKPGEMYPSLKRIVSNIQLTDNPVIVQFKLK